MRRKFGKVMGPADVFSARMPLAFTTYYGNVGRLDKKLALTASPHFSDAKRAALDYATDVTATKHVIEATFAAIERHFSEREICDISGSSRASTCST
jgi:hypothetical protein